jgi:hypothetical protein
MTAYVDRRTMDLRKRKIDSHRLYQKGDANIPDSINDRNGDIVLGLCKVCGCGEIELEQYWCGDLVRDSWI